MDTHAIATALRAAAENLQRAKELVRDLPASAVDDDSAFALWLDAPKVIHALWNVAGTIDPDGELVDLAEVDALVRRAGA